MALRECSAFPPEKWYLTLIVSIKWIAESLQPVMHPITEDIVWLARTKSREHPCSRLYILG